MALSTRQELIDYCLRRLGFPVIEINVDEDQVNDRIDDAIQLWQEYHFDGTERTYVQHKITGSTINLTTSVGGNFLNNDRVVGSTSGASSVVKGGSDTTLTTEDTAGVFVAGETITGSISGTTAILDAIPYVAGDMDNKYIPISTASQVSLDYLTLVELLLQTLETAIYLIYSISLDKMICTI